MKVRVERINRYATKAGKHRTTYVGLPLNAMAGRGQRSQRAVGEDVKESWDNLEFLLLFSSTKTLV